MSLSLPFENGIHRVPLAALANVLMRKKNHAKKNFMSAIWLGDIASYVNDWNIFA
jgi:hypothetical protein